MKLQVIASTAALALAFSLSAPVAAQEYMLRGEQIPVDQVDNFKEACEGLRAANAASLTTDTDDTDPTTTGSTNDSAATTGSPDPAAEEKWLELRATISVEECEEAGFFVN